MAETTHEVSGPVDVFVTNVGLTIDETFGTMIRRGGETVRDVNLGGVCNCTKAFFEDIKVSDPGRLVNISSVRGQQGNPDHANSTATTSMLFGCTRSIALELPPRDQPPLVSPSGSSIPICS